MRRSFMPGWSHCLALALMLTTAVARGQAAAAESVPAEADASTALERDAQALQERAKDLFREGHYREALPLVERAYALTSSPRLLFNLGVLHHKLSECVPARDYFEQYLEREPASVARPQTLAALQELRERCPAQVLPSPSGAPPAGQGVQASGSAATQRPRSNRSLAEPGAERSWAPSGNVWVLLGLGAAAGIGAMVSMAAQRHAQSDIDTLGSRAVGGAQDWDALEAERSEQASNARSYRGLSMALGAASVALLGAGTIVWIIDANDGTSGRPAGAGFGYRGQF